MTTRRVLWVVGVEALLLALLLVVAFDQYLHAGAETTGVNAWGYRGPVAKRRAPDERRIVLVGGTLAFENGVPLPDTVTARMRYLIQEWVTFERGPVTAFNVADDRLSRTDYAVQLERFRALAPDVICIYPDLTAPTAMPEQGVLPRTTGYVPVVPALAWLDRQVGGMLAPAPARRDDVRGVAEAVTTALSIAHSVVVAVGTPVNAAQSRDREALLVAVQPFRADPRVTIVELSGNPPLEVAGLMQPSAAVEIERAVARHLRARPEWNGARR